MNPLQKLACKLYEQGLDVSDIQDTTGLSRETIRFAIGKYLLGDEDLEELDFGDELA